MEIGSYQPGEACGAHFTHYKKENCDIHSSVGISGLVDCMHKVTVEKDAFTGHDVMILTAAHDITKFGDARKEHKGGGPITIHEGVWIATRAIVLGPCEIGKHSVVAAGSVVTHDIPEYEMWGGVPAKKIKDIPHE